MFKIFQTQRYLPLCVSDWMKLFYLKYNIYFLGDCECLCVVSVFKEKSTGFVLFMNCMGGVGMNVV